MALNLPSVMLKRLIDSPRLGHHLCYRAALLEPGADSFPAWAHIEAPSSLMLGLIQNCLMRG